MSNQVHITGGDSQVPGWARPRPENSTCSSYTHYRDDVGKGPGPPGPTGGQQTYNGLPEMHEEPETEPATSNDRNHHLTHHQTEHLRWHPLKWNHKLTQNLKIRRHQTSITLQVDGGRNSILRILFWTQQNSSRADSGAPINSENRGWCNWMPNAGSVSVTAGVVYDVNLYGQPGRPVDTSGQSPVSIGEQ